MKSVRLWPIDLEPSDFGENFDPSKLDHVNCEESEKTGECVLKVLRKVVDLSNQNLVRNTNCLLAKRPHNKQDDLWFWKKKERYVREICSYLLKIQLCLLITFICKNISFCLEMIWCLLFLLLLFLHRNLTFKREKKNVCTRTTLRYF